MNTEQKLRDAIIRNQQGEPSCWLGSLSKAKEMGYDLAASPEKVPDVFPVHVETKAGETHEDAVRRMYPDTYTIFQGRLRSKEEIEHSLQTTYRGRIMSKFTKALKTYHMIQPGDVVGVAISGGKDSLLLAKLFQALVRYSEIPFEVRFLAMDPGYAPFNRERLEFHLSWLGIPATIYRSDIFQVADEVAESPCYLCARMRRGFLYDRAKQMGCNKLALGHHFNDVIETTLLNVLWSANYKNMMPKIVARHFENMELIRPLYLVEEKDIIAWRDHSGLLPLDCACSVTRSKEGSERRNVKNLIKVLKEMNPNVEKSIFRSGENVALDAILGYTLEGKKHSFQEFYGKGGIRVVEKERPMAVREDPVKEIVTQEMNRKGGRYGADS